MKDRPTGGWDNPYELQGFGDHTIKPLLLLQHNWSKMMEYFQNDMYTYYATTAGFPIHKIIFQYDADKEENKAALNFHLTKREKAGIAASLRSDGNQTEGNTIGKEAFMRSIVSMRKLYGSCLAKKETKSTASGSLVATMLSCGGNIINRIGCVLIKNFLASLLITV